MKYIDPHVHCRDGKEAYKTNIREVSEIAKSQGIVAIFDMPNTDPPILIEKDVIERLKLAQERQPVVKYFLYVGLTSDEKQIKEAVELVRKYPEVVGLKLYTVRAGKLGVSRETEQKKIYRILVKLNYQGVLAVHCEKENRFKPKLWNPNEPWTHSLVWPPEAEIESVEDQIKFAKKARFKGHLHICHISCPESVELIWEVKKELKITCGVTPHHILFSEDLLRESQNGLLYKVNPPLRNQERRKMLLEYLKQGKIDIYESDHAPHAWEEKLNPPHLSGVTSLCLYRGGLVWLNQQGVIWPDIEKLTYWNIKKAFGEKLREV